MCEDENFHYVKEVQQIGENGGKTPENERKLLANKLLTESKYSVKSNEGTEGVKA